ncbi:hypothetical protein ASG17_04615 [Brevundimonas sp. Leaf363]|nr:hypothetical protein ASG17_04615 [Brevundimonas sp. Leaf363]
MGGYTLAQIGAFIGFVPLLNVLLPIKAAQIDSEIASLVLSQAAMWGAAAAGLSHLITGLLSDSTRSRWGRRRPWILVGGVLTTLSYVGVYWADTPGRLIAAIVAFQVAFNVMFAPLVTVYADRVPDRQKGVVSAFLGVAYPIANLFAALVIAVALSGAAERYWVVGLTVAVLTAPFAIFGLRETAAPAPRPPIRLSRSFSALADRDFRIVFGSRVLVQTAMALNNLYLLFYLQQDADVASRLPSMRPEAVMGLLIAGATATGLTCGFIGGVWSDRVGNRRLFVAVGAVGLAVGAAVMAITPAWPGPLVGQLIYGLGSGLFATTDNALVAQALPKRENIGRDLGIMNIAITVPQILAPALGILLITTLDWSLSALFGVAAVSALAGGLVVLAARRSL